MILAYKLVKVIVLFACIIFYLFPNPCLNRFFRLFLEKKVFKIQKMINGIYLYESITITI